MHSGLSSSKKEKLQAWLRYYEDLGIQTFYRDRAPWLLTMDKASTGIQKKETAEVAIAKAAQPSEVRAEVAKLHLAGRGPSLFEAAERVEDDSLERICGELAGCAQRKFHPAATSIRVGLCH